MNVYCALLGLVLGYALGCVTVLVSGAVYRHEKRLEAANVIDPDNAPGSHWLTEEETE